MHALSTTAMVRTRRVERPKANIVAWSRRRSSALMLAELKAISSARILTTVEVVPVPGAEQVVNRYPIAVTAEASDPAVAQQFVDAVTSPQGQAVLASYGFGTP